MKHSKLFQFVGMAMLTALVVVLQVLGGSISVGAFSITLVLIPVVIGATLYGPGSGAFLGTLFGVITYINCANGTDMGGSMVFAANPYLCALVCIGKGAGAGFLSGFVYRGVKKLLDKYAFFHGEANIKEYVTVFISAIIAPVANTGLFCTGMLLFFVDTLNAWAAGTPTLQYIIFGLTGVNFLIELGVNLICAPAIVTILNAVRRNMK